MPPLLSQEIWKQLSLGGISSESTAPRKLQQPPGVGSSFLQRSRSSLGGKEQLKVSKGQETDLLKAPCVCQATGGGHHTGVTQALPPPPHDDSQELPSQWTALKVRESLTVQPEQPPQSRP